MRNSPGGIDTLIGRHETAGYGGGRILCPVFDTNTESRNFGFRIEDLPPEELNAQHKDREGQLFDINALITPDQVLPNHKFIDGGEISVLNLSALFFYSIETHYSINPTETSKDEEPIKKKRRLQDFQALNWLRLLRRGVSDPTSERQVLAFLKTAVVRVRLQGSDPTVNPRRVLIDVQTTMQSQIVPGESYGVPVPNSGRIERKARVRRTLEKLRSQTKGLPTDRLKTNAS